MKISARYLVICYVHYKINIIIIQKPQLKIATRPLIKSLRVFIIEARKNKRPVNTIYLFSCPLLWRAIDYIVNGCYWSLIIDLSQFNIFCIPSTVLEHLTILNINSCKGYVQMSQRISVKEINKSIESGWAGFKDTVIVLSRDHEAWWTNSSIPFNWLHRCGIT